MTLKSLALALMLALCASSASAEMIVINGRYIVPKDSIRGYFYRQSGSQQETVFDIRWSDWSTRYGCQDPYDSTRVEAAALNFALQLSEARSLDVEVFLSGEGFTGCSKF